MVADIPERDQNAAKAPEKAQMFPNGNDTYEDGYRHGMADASAAVPVKPKFERAVDFIAKAAEYVGGDRAKAHGDKGLNFRTTAILHTALDEAEKVAAASRRPLDPALKFALKMILAKMSRILSGAYNPDDFVDMAGYAGCAGEIAAQNAKREAACAALAAEAQRLNLPA